MLRHSVVLFVVVLKLVESFSQSDLNSDHMKCFLNTRHQLSEDCKLDRNCKFKADVDRGDSCWGYEAACPRERSYGLSECKRLEGESVVEFRRRETEHFRQADFGYIQQRAESMFPLCSPGNNSTIAASSINCSANLEFCRGHQVALDLRELSGRQEILRYSMDVLKPGQMTANCRVDEQRLASELQFMSPLQSWAPEMRNLRQSKRLKCDVTINTPTYIMKLDAAVSMYHHFCDFFNLYASQHLNESGNSGYPRSFDRDKQIIIWENIPYRSAFAPMFKVFTNRPLVDLSQLAGKRVCFADVVFPLLPRMIFGLFYNTPQVDGCRGSGLFRAFREHALHRLSIPPRTEVPHDTVHVLWISRHTRHRRVLNEQELLTALNSVSSLTVERADFTHATPFELQLRAVSSSDILVGMHGSGLTHMLMLPPWAAVYELYHCGDPHCYRSLADMCSLMYLTSREEGVTAENEGEHPQLGAHEKFTNYTLDVSEVVRIVQLAVRHVRNHSAFIAARRNHQNRQQHEEL